MFWGVITLSFLALLVVVKMLTVLETRSQDLQFRNNTRRTQETTEELDVSRRKYLIAVKSEGVSKHKLSQLKTRWANLKQIQITSAQHEQRTEKEIELTLEKVVMEALGGPTARRDSHFKRVMKVIAQLIDLDKENNSEDLISTVQEKLAEMSKDGSLDASPLAQAREAAKDS
jgi:hypothetical protein